MTSIESLVDRQIRRGQLAERAAQQHKGIGQGSPPFLRVITISRQTGAGGRRLAARIAAQLNFELIDRQVLELLVENSGARERLIHSLDKDVISGIDMWVAGILAGRYIDRSEYAQLLVCVVTALAEHGESVIVGRAANVILGQRGGLHLRLVAPADARVRNLMDWQGLSEKDACVKVARVDEERRRFYRNYFDADADDPEGYHLIINTARVPESLADEMVLSAWHHLQAGER
ncbi:MAG TPA: cytidylate kinase-like family protein [Acidobacteriota bacterium]|nr:cytidylate kinase-like family protein [Acidobacteriota bacterium]